jgi:hypothetical protein
MREQKPMSISRSWSQSEHRRFPGCHSDEVAQLHHFGSHTVFGSERVKAS